MSGVRKLKYDDIILLSDILTSYFPTGKSADVFERPEELTPCQGVQFTICFGVQPTDPECERTQRNHLMNIIPRHPIIAIICRPHLIFSKPILWSIRNKFFCSGQPSFKGGDAT